MQQNFRDCPVENHGVTYILFRGSDKWDMRVRLIHKISKYIFDFQDRRLSEMKNGT